MRILVTGASGLIGKNFIRYALRYGHEVYALVRNPQKFQMLPEDQVFRWNHGDLPPQEAFNGVDAVVHLSGENIAEKSWSKDQKKRITESRLIGTRNIVFALSQLPSNKRPKVLLSGSAIGIYGYSQNGILDENTAPGNDFLANLCSDWEKEAKQAEALGIRVVLARTGIVLSKEGGALSKMSPIQISDGSSWMSWIHIEDMVRAMMHTLKNDSVRGAVNFVAPNPVQNKEFTKELAKVKKIPTFGFVPKSFLDVSLGEVSNVIASSIRIKPKNLLDTGFQFIYSNLQSALEKELLGSHLLDRYLFKDQFVPLKVEEIFHFFSRAENLEILTPPWLNFKIVSKSSEEVRPGTLIEYKLKVHGIPVRWQTLIKDWKKDEFFVDEQLKGPYSKWHHLHTFEKVQGGCLLRDEVTYRVPGSVFGNLLLSKWIEKDVNQIFDYRQKCIRELLQSGWLR